MAQKMRQIVITGPASRAGEEAKVLYRKLKAVCLLYADEVFTPLDTLAFKGTAREKYERGIRLAATSDVLVAEVSAPSTGQGMEIQEAAQRGIPVVALARIGPKVSSMIAGCSAVQHVIRYDGPDQLAEALSRRLGAVAEETSQR